VDQGQGCWNVKRTTQATELINFIATLTPIDPDVIVIGDLNAYGAEDPIVALQTSGLIDQVAAHVPATDRYSYVFDGQAGYLDHALSTASLSTQITNVRHWHINTDEPSVIDYNTEFKPQDLYTPTPYRASDHDPVLIGLNLNAPALSPDFSTSSKTVNTPVIVGSQLFTYTLVVSNSGNVSGTFMLTDTLDVHLTLVNAVSFSVNGSTLTMTGTLNALAAQSFEVIVRATAELSGTIANTATLSGDGQTRVLNAPSVMHKPIYAIYLPLIQK
jgi:uncharacterized repeat protein (TIGR01451 family)